MSAPTQPKRRKVAPPCWTQDESHALIAAYKGRFSALTQSYLKTPDWNSIAITVATQFPLASPPKTAVECRHKMDNLRRRYRTEKARASKSPPGLFLSSWDLFQAMSDLESDRPSVFGPGQRREVRIGVQFGGGFPVRKDEGYRYLADDSDQNSSDPHEESGKGVGVGGGFRVKAEDNSNLLAAFDRYVSRGSDGASGLNKVVLGFPVKSFGDRNLGLPDFRTKNYHGRSNGYCNPKLNVKRDCNYGVGNQKFPRGLGLKGVVFEDSGGGCSSLTRAGKEVDDDAMEEIASSVEFLGEMFAKMEKRKMEMAREVLKMGMEREMKQNKLIMESQKEALAACVDALLESQQKHKKKKKKMELRQDTGSSFCK